MITKCRFGTKLRVSIAILVTTCLFFEHVKGSCLSYGHSCWGAHGKRGGPPKRAVSVDGRAAPLFRPQPSLDQTNTLPPALTATDRWALVRVFPDKNAFYPFSKLIRPLQALPASPLFFRDDANIGGPEVPSGTQETSNSIVGRSAGTSNDSKQMLTSAELEALDEGRLLAASSRPAATTNGRRRDHPRGTKPLTTRTRYSAINDSYEDNPSTDRLMAPTDEDIGQMLLLDAAAAAAAAESSDTDRAIGPFNRKLLSVSG